MTPEEKYVFDLQGYLVLDQVLPAAMVSGLNQALDEMESLGDEEAVSRGVKRRYTEGSPYATLGAAGPGGLRDYTCEILAYGGLFEDLIDWAPVLTYVESMIGEPFRLDGTTFMRRNPGGAIAFHHGYAELLPYSEYAFDNGAFGCVSVKISYALTDVDVEDGCFAVIPGSHKSNFQNALVGTVPESDPPLVKPVPTRAGDGIIFSEDLSHGAVHNKGSEVRGTLFYSYARPFIAAGGGRLRLPPGSRLGQHLSRSACWKGRFLFKCQSEASLRLPQGVLSGLRNSLVRYSAVQPSSVASSEQEKKG